MKLTDIQIGQTLIIAEHPAVNLVKVLSRVSTGRLLNLRVRNLSQLTPPGEGYWYAPGDECNLLHNYEEAAYQCWQPWTVEEYRKCFPDIPFFTEQELP